MLYAIISDIHANLEALDRVLADARACGAERIVCLGDVVGYGPRPAETVSRIREVCAETVAGNHDDAVSGRMDTADFIDLAGDAVARHRVALAPDARAWLAALPYSAAIEGATLAHGDATAPAMFCYVENEDDAAANFKATDAQLLFIGHTHVPCVFLTGSSGAVYRIAPQDFSLEDGKRYIVNPGSVGYPRESNGKCMSSYVLYDSAERTVCYRFLPFSVASVMQRGPSPRRLKKRALFAAAAVIALAAGAAAWLLAPQPAPEVVVEDADAALVVDSRSLAPLEGHRAVRANLKLEHGSDQAKVRVKMLGEGDAVLSDESTTVKSSLTKAIRIPLGAKSAEFTVYRLKPGESPRIASFAPAAEM